MERLRSNSFKTEGPSTDTEHVSKILIIEDQWPICQMYAAALCLTNPHYDVTLAYTGEEGVEAAIQDRPDLVILDLSLPGISGVEVVENLKELGILPDVPLIIASGLGDGASGIVEQVHATAFLAKPFPLNTMLSAVQVCLSGPAQ